jgi:hypothetical protein
MRSTSSGDFVHFRGFRGSYFDFGIRDHQPDAAFGQQLGALREITHAIRHHLDGFRKISTGS